MKDPKSDNWTKVENRISLKLKKNEHEFSFRVVNLANATGSAHKIILKRN